MKLLLLLLSTLVAFSSFAQDKVGEFTFNQDIGHPNKKGSASYDSVSQSYTVNGVGRDIWGTHDEFHYVWQKMTGDFILTATFKLQGETNDPTCKVGWMVRKSDDPASAHMSAALHGDGLTVLQWRSETGVDMAAQRDEQFFPKRNVEIMQLEHKGDIFVMRAARYGEPLQIVGFREMKSLTGEMMVGLFACAHDSDGIVKAVVSNLRIDKPVPSDYDPNRIWRVESRLETMDVFSGDRKVVLLSGDRLESPNWMPSGEKILFSASGRLFTVPLSGSRRADMLNTGSATRLNGAHCISPDGKIIGTGSQGEKWPEILFLPLNGGEPDTVVNEMPAYLHGISPDSKEVVFTAPSRDLPVFDIYKKAIKGGTAVRLTDSKKYGFADGCEYTPDGKYIYYNASEIGGTMQIWRMKTDGSDKEQLTFGAVNNWFPHISPDGKWMVFISFPASTALNTHPAYAPVEIRLMPVSGGAPKVIAYIYGGQGTLDENSWSPDSRHISFVSYSVL